MRTLGILTSCKCEIRPILVLPPADIQMIECEQSEAEHDFYDALFKRSKVSSISVILYNHPLFVGTSLSEFQPMN